MCRYFRRCSWYTRLELCLIWTGYIPLARRVVVVNRVPRPHVSTLSDVDAGLAVCSKQSVMTASRCMK